MRDLSRPVYTLVSERLTLRYSVTDLEARICEITDLHRMLDQ